ncbi:MAG TPA: glycoside hydrolase family 5 protein [Fimbriimonas sp.]|nr:glycoside hydrolase family 5 protein [Fimbriimonas sp.]
MIGAALLLGMTLSPLSIKGNQVVNDQGKVVRLRGVNTACMEWSNDGEGHILESVRVSIKDWKVNHIRLPLSQDRWFGLAPEQKDKGAAYRALVKQVVDYCAANNCYVMLDLHWNNAGMWGQNIGQHLMPDMNSVTFWKDCARTYRNHPAVIFDLYNEPHDITWEVWRDGGELTESRGVGARNGPFIPSKYKTPGMQALLNTVRSTGAKNLIVAGGLDWSYDLSGFLKGYALKDPKGRGVLYACHAYPFKGDTVEKWLTKVDAALPHIPVIVSEFGADSPGAEADKPNPWVVQVIDAMEKRKMHWTAWDFHPAASPILIKDWNYTPTPHFGAIVKSALSK